MPNKTQINHQFPYDQTKPPTLDRKSTFTNRNKRNPDHISSQLNTQNAKGTKFQQKPEKPTWRLSVVGSCLAQKTSSKVSKLHSLGS